MGRVEWAFMVLTQVGFLEGLSIVVEAGAAGSGGGAPCGNPVWGTGNLPFPSTALALFLNYLPV